MSVTTSTPRNHRLGKGTAAAVGRLRNKGGSFEDMVLQARRNQRAKTRRVINEFKRS